MKAKLGLKGYPPCVNGQYITEWMNKADVRAALNVPDNYPGWEMCNDHDWWNYSILKIGSQWIYESLKGKMRMLHFTGDIDGAVPSLGTYDWIQSMNPDVVADLRPYMYEGHVAGYIEQYDGLDYITVHGAGHMVPQDKPKEAFHMITNWIKGNKL
jgi:carboxypeptidase C (cathepsin A)